MAGGLGLMWIGALLDFSEIRWKWVALGLVTGIFLMLLSLPDRSLNSKRRRDD